MICTRFIINKCELSSEVLSLPALLVFVLSALIKFLVRWKLPFTRSFYTSRLIWKRSDLFNLTALCLSVVFVVFSSLILQNQEHMRLSMSESTYIFPLLRRIQHELSTPNFRLFADSLSVMRPICEVIRS